MILKPVNTASGTKRKNRKGRGAKTRQQLSQRKRSKNSLLKRQLWLAEKKGKSVINITQDHLKDVSLEIVPQAAYSSASMSRLIGFGLLGGAVYAILKRS